jgi:lysophospholipase
MGMLSARPGPLGVQYFVPQGRPKGTVFIAHGYLDHAGPLRPLIAPLVEEGFSVVAFDLPGHGFSGGERGAIADFADYGTAAGRLVGLFLGTEDDLEVPAPGTEAAFPRPWTALGHSTGAAAFFIYLTNRASRGLASPFDAVLFINPLVRSARWRLSVTGLFLFGWAVRNYDPRHVPDPLLGINNFPVSWAERLRDWNARIKNVPPFRHTGRILQGLADEVVDYRYNVPFLLKKITGTDVLYLEGVDHVPYTDRPENRQVVEELLRYLRR